jgi:hypothetical protein
LRRLRDEAGIGSYRALGNLAHYSHTSLAEAAAGKTLPSLAVTIAFVRACGGDVESWRRRWTELSSALGERDVAVVAASPWPRQDVVDGADPLASDCHIDAITVAVSKVAMTGQRHIIGELELRYCRGKHAAWGRFKGTEGLDKLAFYRHTVDVVVGITRDTDGKRLGFQVDYAFDYHWGDLLTTGDSTFCAWVIVRFDGAEVAYGETERIQLS